jgi:hypothetical protein
MSLFEDTNPRELKQLLGQIHSGETVLPDFQRDFVWDPSATQELIVSIANNYPAGSLLRIRNTHNLFAYREFQGAPETKGRPTYLVLDGQQRLTSLYQAFFGVGDHRYYLNVKDLLDGADFEEAIYHLRSNVTKVKEHEDPEYQAENLILPLSVLQGGAGAFARWMFKVSRKLSGDQRDKLQDQLSALSEAWIQVIDDYKFPVVTLSDETSAEAVCTIFETLNRTGVKLSPFELLTARFWPKEVNLRDLWATACAEYPIIPHFDIDPYYVLQITSLASASEKSRAPSAKRRAVLDLEAELASEWWDRAIFGLAEGLKMLRDDCGVAVPKWLPYNTIVIPLAAVLAQVALRGSPQLGANRKRLTRWFWCSVFAQTYENAPNSQAAKDMVELLAWLAGGAEPESVRFFRFDPRSLRDTTIRQRALYRGVIALILSRNPRDFHTGKPIGRDVMLEGHVDDHHVFPQAFLSRIFPESPQRLRDSVLNRTLIDRTTNILISDRAPSAYMEDIRNALAGTGQDMFDRLLSSHLLPGGHDSPLFRDDFQAFLDWREESLWQLIKRVTGASERSDLVVEEISA